MKRGFTIIEMMMVIGIIAVLMGITVATVTGSLKSFRKQRKEALCTLVAEGINTYYAQNGDWPGALKNLNRGNDTNISLTGSEVKDTIFELVKSAKEGKPYMDISGLFVADHNPDGGVKVKGMDFMTAVRKQRLKASTLYYGYQDFETGDFKRFNIIYNTVTDSIRVE